MGKYEPLSGYLQSIEDESWDARFADVEKVLGFSLPRSAHQYPAWWANQDGGHSQTRGWRDAGWETSNVDLRAKRLRFVRRGENRSALGQSAHASSKRDLWEQARKLSGIEGRDALIDAALTALIHREASRRLAELGGSMPDFEVPPRERPDL